MRKSHTSIIDICGRGRTVRAMAAAAAAAEGFV
jgi:hypothetical protein